MNEFTDVNEMENIESTKHVTEMSQKDLFDVMSRFSGLDENGIPKATVTYCSYNAEASEEEIEKQPVITIEDVMVELSVDWKTGFYTLDLIFDNPDNRFLKMMWAKLQQHKHNETYDGEKLWVFYISIMENNSVVNENGDSDIFVANIINPLLFFLTRQVPNQEIFDEDESDPNVFYGGNCIRMLLHKELVQFKYIPTDELQDEPDNEPEE